MPTAERSPKGSYSTFLAIACAALAAITVMLALQNRALKAQLAEERAEAPTPRSQPLRAGIQPGRVFDALPVRASDGATDTLALARQDGRRTLLLFFSPECRACEAIKPAWVRLAPRARRLNVEVAAIYMADDGAAAESRDAAIEIASNLPCEVHEVVEFWRTPLVDANAIPATILLDPQGVVTHVWSGIAPQRLERDVSAALDEAPDAAD